MAIYHCSMKPVSRSGGRSAVAAIAYRTASRIVNERDGLVHDFTAKAGVVHVEIVLPEGSEARWALDRSVLWNAVEFAEKRKDARLAREFEVALPHELNAGERLTLVRAFARDLADRHGAAVDFAIHAPGGDSDIRNSHAHVMMTTRKVEASGLGEKTLIERENKWLLNHDLPTAQMQLREIRHAWETHANRALMLAGHEVRIDHRSHLERGLEIEPTERMGVHASEIDRRGGSVSRTRIDAEAARRNAELIREKPEQVLTLITGEKSVFDRYDVARALHRYIDDAGQFRNAFAAVMGSKALVELRKETGGELARYTTREMLEIEHAMAVRADRMSRHSPSQAGSHASRNGSGHGVDRHHVDRALRLQDEAIRAMTDGSSSRTVERQMRTVPWVTSRYTPPGGLSEEQRLAVRHVTGPERIAAVIGFAGAGKSTMLAAALTAWEAQGYRVHGAALAGKAAEGLEESSGITSRTLASWEHSWQAGRAELQSGDILVIDEAGMVGSRQLGRFVEEVERRGAKLVLVGDHEQLQAIGAGSPFRAIAERIGAVELSEIRRQKEEWQRQASIAFATHRTGEGLSAYAERDQVRFAENREGAREALMRDYLADRDARPEGSRVALAHRRIDVRAINDAVRSALQARGDLAKAALGDFVQGIREGQGQGADSVNREIVYQTNDGKRGFAPSDRIVLLENNRDLGVKNGMLGTVTAVEPDALQLRLDGAGQNAARVISIPVRSYQSFDHGYATTIHKAQGATVDRAFVMASATMDRHLTYVAMTRHREAVTLYAGRNELKEMKTLSASLGRSGAKETVLDYTDAFAARRGLGEGIGVTSEIVMGPTPQRDAAQRADDRMAAHYGALGERVRPPADRQPFEETARAEIGQAHRTENGPSADAQDGKVQPLVPVITHYAQTIEEVALAEVSRHLEQVLGGVRSLGRGVFANPEQFAGLVAKTLRERNGDVADLADAVAKSPEAFGALLGKAGLLGENRERRQARQLAGPLGAHVGRASRHWTRRYEEAVKSEQWKREKQDVIEVPGLSAQSEKILRQLDGLERAKKPAFLEKLVGMPEGRRALEEAEAVADAMRQRFGTDDLRHKDLIELTRRQAERRDLARLAEMARITHQAKEAANTRKYELVRSQIKGLSMGI
ncbi:MULTISPECIES: Ti-type conjugative transfer relaxase TraA [unclassified Agrobacterium]|uniref:Ti-type conjugative transfer relaxase TraA n=1 Tax=unclassified Agrobacterium TaxID=2632611 RepID=UPI00083CFCED|nr:MULTISPECIES: Ti-type conjugative transfer relaxase TraA [unclassified Agrobacterium]AOG08616.1 Ti-type conjugative transfer relaxase TraA [Agrobacterium sp. RAC06]QGG90997.1 Ti-type conjugative transfer relaxase TraA [Agrobacterium sp. MA01]